ncbi:MAG: type IV conjugative transfer system lipoprotein TraV [Burkholderiales bacterium]|nr:type IV conjugative transfer system lipoprotein TraV [Burkholderiales bacterium]
MKTIALSLIACSSAMFLTGCGGLTGFANAHTDFACADISGKPSCKTISDIYNEDNSINTGSRNAREEEAKGKFIPASNKEEKCPGGCTKSNILTASGEAVQTSAISTPLEKVVVKTKAAGSAEIEEVAVSIGQEAYPSPVDYAVIAPAVPWRKPETILRVWMAPFTDQNGDLHDQRYLYVKVVEASWSAPALDEMAKARSPFRPVYPLSVQKEEETPPKKENPLNFLKAANAS